MKCMAKKNCNKEVDLKYLLKRLLPYLRQLDEEQMVEKKIEAKKQGIFSSKLMIWINVVLWVNENGADAELVWSLYLCSGTHHAAQKRKLILNDVLNLFPSWLLNADCTRKRFVCLFYKLWQTFGLWTTILLHQFLLAFYYHLIWWAALPGFSGFDSLFSTNSLSLSHCISLHFSFWITYLLVILCTIFIECAVGVLVKLVFISCPIRSSFLVS